MKPYNHIQIKLNLCSVDFDPMNKLMIFPAPDAVRVKKSNALKAYKGKS